MNNSESLGSIILAAGPSSRLGQPKQLVRVHGVSLVKRAVDAVSINNAIDSVALVIGANADAISNCDDLQDTPDKVSLVLNKDWSRGMGKSISTGMQFLMNASPQLSGVLITVCDQPEFSDAIVDELVSCFVNNPGHIVASAYSRTIGTPALFPREDFELLAGLDGSTGARQILKQSVDRVIAVNFPGGDYDIDTPEDLERLSL